MSFDQRKRCRPYTLVPVARVITGGLNRLMHRTPKGDILFGGEDLDLAGQCDQLDWRVAVGTHRKADFLDRDVFPSYTSSIKSEQLRMRSGSPYFLAVPISLAPVLNLAPYSEFPAPSNR